MSFTRKIELDNFSGGLMTDPEAAKLPKTASSRLENADVRNGFMETLPGVAEVNTGLPVGFVKLSEIQLLITEPTEEECTLVHGTLSGVDKLYIRPYPDLAGAWVDAWQDLTEKEGNYTTDSGTNTTTIVDAQILSSVDDYYNQCIVYNVTRSAAAIVTDYVGSTKTLTLAWAIGSQTSGDTYFIVRNPIWKTDGSSWFDADGTACRFLQRGNHVDIITGSSAIYDVALTPNKCDLHLSLLNGYTAFKGTTNPNGDTDLNFTGFHLALKPPAAPAFGIVTSLAASTVAGGEQPLANGAYIVLAAAVYDGYQEGPLYKGITSFDGTRYSANSVNLTGSDKRIDFNLSFYYGRANTNTPRLLTPSKDDVEDFASEDRLVFDRRITGFRIYAATGALVNSLSTHYEITSEWHYVLNVPINESAASGNSWIISGSPSYSHTALSITNAEWNAAEGVDISDRQGHASLKVHMNADFIAHAKRRTAVASVYADEARTSFVFFSAINSDAQNTPDVLPHTSFIDLSLYGIPKIMAFFEALGFYVAIGETQLVKIDAATLAVDKNIQSRGISSAEAIVNANGLLYFVNLEDIYYYHPGQDVIRSIATGFVREAWRALATADKQAAAIGYDRRYEKLVIAAGATIYTYNLPQAFASPEVSDIQAVGSWAIYNVAKTFIRFYTDLIGRCIGIANDGKSYEMFSPGVANTMIYEKVFGDGELGVHTVRATYEASAAWSAKLFDLAKSTTYPLMPMTFAAQATHKRRAIYNGAQIKRLMLQISAPLGTKISSIEFNPDVLDEN